MKNQEKNFKDEVENLLNGGPKSPSESDLEPEGEDGLSDDPFDLLLADTEKIASSMEEIKDILAEFLELWKKAMVPK